MIKEGIAVFVTEASVLNQNKTESCFFKIILIIYLTQKENTTFLVSKGCIKGEM